MRKLIKIILSEVRVGNLKIRPRGDNRCESAQSLGTQSLGTQSLGKSALPLPEFSVTLWMKRACQSPLGETIRS